MNQFRIIVLAVLVLCLLAGCSQPITPSRQADVAGETTAQTPAPSSAETTAPSPAAPTADGLTPFGTLPDGTRIVLLAWNDLGMHCFNEDFSKLAILPPYNNLYAQVIAVGDHPRAVTKGVTVEYRYPDNTYSVGAPGKPEKSNFWTYAKALFGADLKPNVGLTGRGLTGSLDQTSTWFVAEGIPVTDYRDQDAAAKRLYPYQVARVTVKDASGQAVAGLDVVTPVSTEMRCDRCHADDGDATKMGGIKPTGDVYGNIVALHDKLNAGAYAKLGAKPLAESEPVLCASCHGSNALGAPGKPGVSSMSNAMHKRHADKAPEIPATSEGCQYCHPGPQTRCLRDVHSQTLGFQCQNCHGTLQKVAQNPEPWLNEPRCDDPACHKNTPAAQLRQTKPLYRKSIGHHGGVLLCEACHDSTHALAKSREANDNLKFRALQGDATYLRKCAVCHGTDTHDGQSKAHAPED